MPLESSPYVFDEDFYTNNPNLLNDNLDAETANYGTANNHHMKRLREAYERIIDSAVLEAFTPLDMPDPARLMRAHLPDSCIVDDPASFFEIFLYDEDFDLLATNTNKYAEQYPTLYPGNSQRVFKPTNRQEIKVLLAI